METKRKYIDKKDIFLSSDIEGVIFPSIKEKLIVSTLIGGIFGGIMGYLIKKNDLPIMNRQIRNAGGFRRLAFTKPINDRGKQRYEQVKPILRLPVGVSAY